MLEWIKNLFKKEEGPREIPERERVLARELSEARLTADTMSRQLQTAEEELFTLRKEKQDLILKSEELKTKPIRHENISVNDLTFIGKYLDNRGTISEEEIKPYIDMNPDIKIKYNSSPQAMAPTKFIEGDAGYDLFVPLGTSMEVMGMRRGIIDTGVKVDIPKGYYGRIVPRTSVSVREGLIIMNEVIDSSYKDTIKVVIANVVQNEPVWIKPGMRIASLIIEKCSTVGWEETENEIEGAKNMLGATGE